MGDVLLNILLLAGFTMGVGFGLQSGWAALAAFCGGFLALRTANIGIRRM